MGEEGSWADRGQGSAGTNCRAAWHPMRLEEDQREQGSWTGSHVTALSNPTSALPSPSQENQTSLVQLQGEVKEMVGTHPQVLCAIDISHRLPRFPTEVFQGEPSLKYRVSEVSVVTKRSFPFCLAGEPPEVNKV